MNNKKILIISCAIFITLLAGGAIAATKLPGVTAEEAKNLDYDQDVFFNEILPCDEHELYETLPACKNANPKPNVRGANTQTGNKVDWVKKNKKHGIIRIGG